MWTWAIGHSQNQRSTALWAQQINWNISFASLFLLFSKNEICKSDKMWEHMHFLGPHFFAFPTSSSFLNLLTRFYPNRALTAKVEKRRVAVSDSTSLFDMLDQKQIRQQRVMPYLLLSANSCCFCVRKKNGKHCVETSKNKSHCRNQHWFLPWKSKAFKTRKTLKYLQNETFYLFLNTELEGVTR